jgi:hypothetical protein
VAPARLGLRSHGWGIREPVRNFIDPSPAPNILEFLQAASCLCTVGREFGLEGNVGQVGEGSAIQFIGRKVTASLNGNLAKESSIGKGVGHDIGILLQLERGQAGHRQGVKLLQGIGQTALIKRTALEITG